MDVTECVESYQPQRAFSFVRSDRTMSKIKKWRGDILRDLSLLPKPKGRQLGQVIVYGDDAVPLLYSQTPEQVIMAAAEIGQDQGRIVVLSHHKYLENFGKEQEDENLAILHENINHWVTRGEFANNDQILDLKDVSEISDIEAEKHKILVWNSWKEASPTFQDEITDYIVTGGSLVYALSSVKWKAKFSHVTMEQVPLGNVLKRAGIGFSQHIVPYSEETGIQINLSASTPEYLAGVHLKNLIQNCTTEINGQKLHAYAKVFIRIFQDVPPHIVEHMKDKLYTLYAKCNEVVHKNRPSAGKAIHDLRALACISISGALSELQLGYNKVPGIEAFPGDFTGEKPCLQSAIIEIKSELREAHSTGYYVPAGSTIRVKIICEQGSVDDVNSDDDDSVDSETDIDEMTDEWFIRIGAHSDILHHKDVLLRWPNLMIKSPIKSTMTVFSPYGGLLYILSPTKVSKITLQINGIVDAPSFDLKNPVTSQNWETIRTLPGLWADISGEFFRITVPSSSVRELDNPAELMKMWDKIVLANHELRGTKPFRKEWLVADVQPVIGKAHSGYPIVVLLKKAGPDGVLNLHKLQTTGSWGIFHEIGHNMQRHMWTFDGTREVTCNIFTLYILNTFCQQTIWIHSWIMKQMPKIESYLQSGSDYTEWDSTSVVGLCFYAQLAHYFGWESYQNVFRGYEAMSFEMRPVSNQNKIDRWIDKFSEAVGHNICPVAMFWGIPVSDHIHEKNSDMIPFLPEDEIMSLGEKRVNDIKIRYPQLVRKVNWDKVKEKHWCPLV